MTTVGGTEVGLPTKIFMITKEEVNILERCLKTGLQKIYQEKYITY